MAALVPRRLDPHAGKSREDVMTFQISRRGKQYLETAQTLLRSAKTMTDTAVAHQLQALAEDYQRRAEKASQDDAAKAADRATSRANQLEAYSLV